MEYVKIVLPYLVSILTALISYIKATKKYKIELDKLEQSHKNDLEKILKQHEIDIDNLKEKHKLEMEVKEKDHKHEIEMQKLKSQSAIEEKDKELIGSSLYGAVGDIFKDIMTGKITKSQLEDLQKQFPTK